MNKSTTYSSCVLFTSPVETAGEIRTRAQNIRHKAREMLARSDAMLDGTEKGELLSDRLAHAAQALFLKGDSLLLRAHLRERYERDHGQMEMFST